MAGPKKEEDSLEFLVDNLDNVTDDIEFSPIEDEDEEIPESIFEGIEGTEDDDFGVLFEPLDVPFSFVD